jgi:DNA-binding winged helix-turn-helix (wHTH) protein
MKAAFGPFVLDSDARLLLRNGRPVHLPPKAFDLLQLLVERRPAVVGRAEVQDRVWPGTFVEEANVSVLVADIRRALDDDPRVPAFIRTVHGRGYAFCGPVEEPQEEETFAGGDAFARCWLAWGEHTRRLAPGENLIGRDPQCPVWIDAPGVSRRHARISVRAEGIVLEDLGSTNGTFVGRKKLSGPHQLADGDTIAFGPEKVVFRAWSPERPPATEPVRGRRSASPRR